jgi:hypothetical protein
MANMKDTTAEQQRLDENAAKEVPLEKWGPYLSERQWGTVREDYSADGDAWNYFPHDHARSRVYRWGEDGLAGISDYFQNLCFSVALWNHKDPILKERLFGLTNNEGNHGEDVKELYYYLDNLPTHYYMKYLYKYPQNAYPYEDLIIKNRQRSRQEPEYEILDTGVFNNHKYFDVFVEYAKQGSEDIFIKIEIANRSTDTAAITVLPTLWFYNRWQYGGLQQRPVIESEGDKSVKISHERLGTYYLYFSPAAELFFTENETNKEKLFGQPSDYPFVKDAFNEAIVNNKNLDALRNNKKGTKFSPVYRLNIKGGQSEQLFLRLTSMPEDTPFKEGFAEIFDTRKKEADEFYASILPSSGSKELANIQRQAFAGLLWNKQYYHYDLERWLNTDDGITAVSRQRQEGRNHNWKYLKNQDIIVMPDKWEYPWYATWDTAFHCVAMAIIDPAFAKNQLLLLMREWYMNPEGQMPGYEWNFSDVNPPVHAFAALEVYRKEKEMKGQGDIAFLKRIFQKLMINFTWWTNRKDINGNNIFEGGFLGLDNIGVFNRSSKLPGEITLEQADGTSWMGIYALNMLDIALEITAVDKSFEDSCTKFYEHFTFIAEALNELCLWNEEDNFFYDVLSFNGAPPVPVKVKSVVGLIPLFAGSIINLQQLSGLNDFKKRMRWFREYRLNNNKFLPAERKINDNIVLISLLPKKRLLALLHTLLDEEQFLSEAGIRALSKFYKEHPYMTTIEGVDYSIQYDPGDSTSGLFGGNSNWRGPVWVPMNYLLIKGLQKFGSFYGDTLQVECPTGSGNMVNLESVAAYLVNRITKKFVPDDKGERAIYNHYNWFYQQEENKDLVLFHEYFHGDNAMGLGASHQTGWTALVADLVRKVVDTSK